MSIPVCVEIYYFLMISRGGAEQNIFYVLVFDFCLCIMEQFCANAFVFVLRADIQPLYLKILCIWGKTHMFSENCSELFRFSG